MEYVLYYILILFSIFQIKSDLIVLPFQIKDVPGKKNQQFIYTSFEIGEPKQKVEGEINFKNSTFFMVYNNEIINETYNPTKSETFDLISKNVSIRDLDESSYLAKENFNFYSDMNCQLKKKYENIPIVVPSSDTSPEKNTSLSPIIGLQIESQNKSYNFIDILKSKKITNNYYWTIKFSTSNNGTIIIGDLPHIYDQKNYKENNLLFVNTYSTKNKLYWGMHISSVKFYGITMNDNIIGKIDPKILEIFGSYEYITTIGKIFFQKYIDNNICKRIWDEVNGEDVFRFICEKDKFNTSDINDFPSIQLINTEMNTTFEFNGNELFHEKDDKIIFQIVAKTGRTDGEWILGRIFLLKYQIMFDNDNNLIGIYLSKNDNEENDKVDINNKGHNVYMILIIILIVILLIIISLLVYMAITKKGICKNKRKRLAELNDDFVYIPSNNVI
jgi:hypothetical protein